MSKFKTIHEAIAETLEYVKGRMDGKITSLKTGFPKLDKAMIDGIEWNSTITLGGRPSVGKSAVSDCIVEGCFNNNDINDFHFLDFNWELSSRVTLLRRLSSKMKNSYKHIISAEKNKLTEKEYNQIVEYLTEYYGNLPITYCEEPLSVREFSDTVERFYKEVNKKLLVRIDHTLLTKETANDGGQVKMLLNLLMAANTLKKKYPIIFLFLTQINREFEDRQLDGTDSAFPRQGDVYGGDAAAMFSETIILLNKPSKYGIKQYGRRGGAINIPIEEDDLFAHIVKNRNSNPDLILHYKENFKNMLIKEY
jgi:replicative DNA helicase